MHITPDMMEAAYRLLLTTLPFRRWSLPDPDNIDFIVSMHRDRHAHCRPYKHQPGRYEIAVSAYKVKTIALLIECIAHEIVHVEQDKRGMRDNHGKGFKRLALTVCRRHNWDIEAF